MNTYHKIIELRRILKENRRLGKRIGFVPTMGNLHDAHIELVRQAKQNNDVVVCSIFVNPLQFGANEDLEKYPRTLAADAEKLEAVGCDFLFNPLVGEMYPNGLDQQTRVVCPTMTDVLCGASRPGHFEGVTTVVAKLFNIVQPDEVYFGLKDFQQLAVIRRMVEDLCMDISIVGVPTVREPDGLAMSSRNGFITADERSRVTVLSQTLHWIADEIRSGSVAFSDLEDQGKQRIAEQGFPVDYLVISNSTSLAPAEPGDKEITILGAMFTEGARLIDNLSISL